MESCGLFLDNRVIGKIQWEINGNSVHFHAFCPYEAGYIYRAELVLGGISFSLGVMLPKGERFEITKNVGKSYCAMVLEENVKGRVIRKKIPANAEKTKSTEPSRDTSGQLREVERESALEAKKTPGGFAKKADEQRPKGSYNDSQRSIGASLGAQASQGYYERPGGYSGSYKGFDNTGRYIDSDRSNDNLNRYIGNQRGSVRTDKYNSAQAIADSKKHSPAGGSVSDTLNSFSDNPQEVHTGNILLDNCIKGRGDVLYAWKSGIQHIYYPLSHDKPEKFSMFFYATVPTMINKESYGMICVDESGNICEQC